MGLLKHSGHVHTNNRFCFFLKRPAASRAGHIVAFLVAITPLRCFFKLVVADCSVALVASKNPLRVLPGKISGDQSTLLIGQNIAAGTSLDAAGTRCWNLLEVLNIICTNENLENGQFSQQSVRHPIRDQKLICGHQAVII